MQFSVGPNFFSRVLTNTRYARYKQAKTIVDGIVGDNRATKSILSTFDWGRYAAFTNPFKKSIKLYNVVNTNKNDAQRGFITDCVTCYFNRNNELASIVMTNAENKSISIYNKFGKRVLHYTPEEAKAIFTYKHDSRSIHKILRYGLNCKNVKNESEIRKNIDMLSNIFKYKGKYYEATEDMIVYRALDKTSLKKIMSMQEDGGIFTDPSFVSVATKLNSVFPFLNFKNFNHIMKIRIPKGSKFLNLDEIGHSIIMQPAENELLLNKGAKFLIKTKKGHYNMIEADYIS